MDEKTETQKTELNGTKDLILDEAAKVRAKREQLKAENDNLELEMARSETLRSQTMMAGKSEIAQPIKPETAKEYSNKIMSGKFPK
jgi:hypothetical protein